MSMAKSNEYKLNSFVLDKIDTVEKDILDTLK